MNNFGIRLKILRKEKKLRQQDLAQALGIAQTTIANYECNNRFPNEETLRRLSEYFHVSYDYLLGRNAPYNKENYLVVSNKQQDYIDDSLPYLYKQYLTYLLDGKKELATGLITRSIKNGIDIRDICLYILEPSLKEVGHLWELGSITVADEHYFSCNTLHIMSLLHFYMKINPKLKRSILSFTPGSELHNIGIRMVTDFFEMDGWETYFLGSITPTESIIASIKKYNIDLIAISCTMDYHINSVGNVIKAIRKCDDCTNTKIIVGGYCFYHDNLLWRKIGADGFALNALDAVILGNKLVL